MLLKEHMNCTRVCIYFYLHLNVWYDEDSNEKHKKRELPIQQSEGNNSICRAWRTWMLHRELNFIHIWIYARDTSLFWCHIYIVCTAHSHIVCLYYYFVSSSWRLFVTKKIFPILTLRTVSGRHILYFNAILEWINALFVWIICSIFVLFCFVSISIQIERNNWKMKEYAKIANFMQTQTWICGIIENYVTVIKSSDTAKFIWELENREEKSNGKKTYLWITCQLFPVYVIDPK